MWFNKHVCIVVCMHALGRGEGGGEGEGIFSTRVSKVKKRAQGKRRSVDMMQDQNQLQH